MMLLNLLLSLRNLVSLPTITSKVVPKMVECHIYFPPLFSPYTWELKHNIDNVPFSHLHDPNQESNPCHESCAKLFSCLKIFVLRFICFISVTLLFAMSAFFSSANGSRLMV